MDDQDVGAKLILFFMFCSVTLLMLMIFIYAIAGYISKLLDQTFDNFF